MFTYPGVDQPVQTSTDSHVPLVPRIVQDVASTTPIGVSKDVVRSESFILILIFLLEISRPLKIRDISTEFLRIDKLEWLDLYRVVPAIVASTYLPNSSLFAR